MNENQYLNLYKQYKNQVDDFLNNIVPKHKKLNQYSYRKIFPNDYESVYMMKNFITEYFSRNNIQIDFVIHDEYIYVVKLLINIFTNNLEFCPLCRKLKYFVPDDNKYANGCREHMFIVSRQKQLRTMKSNHEYYQKYLKKRKRISNNLKERGILSNAGKKGFRKTVNKIKNEKKKYNGYLYSEFVIKQILDSKGFKNTSAVEGFVIPKSSLIYYPVEGRGNYQPDFYLPDYNLIIEIDGKYHKNPAVISEDKYRDYILIRNGYRVLRFYHEAYNNKEVIIDFINKFIKNSKLKYLRKGYRYKVEGSTTIPRGSRVQATGIRNTRPLFQGMK